MPKCSNCHCDIEDSKMALHERFCIQNITYCELCKEGIIKEEYEEHCLEHENSGAKDEKSQEEKDILSLKRVESTKIQCQFCGLFLSFGEVTEHEDMCGSRTTKCKLCGERTIYKNLENHAFAEHGLTLALYKECDSLVLEDALSSLNLNKDKSKNDSYSYNKSNSNDLSLNNLTSSEQIAYALAMSEQEQALYQNKNAEKESKSKEKDIKKEVGKEVKKEDVKEHKKGKVDNDLNLPKKKSSKIDYDEIEYEYQKQMYEDEIKNME